MLKRIMAAMFALAIAFAGIVGFASAVNADNDRYEYSFYNGYSSGGTQKRSKISNKKVYVHPMSGPTLKYRVQGSVTGSTWTNRSSQVTIYNGNKVKITNSVFSNNEGWARLFFTRTTTANTNTFGYWNPEPT